MPAAKDRVQRREDLFVRQVTGGTEQHQGIALGFVMVHECPPPCFSRWPPKPKRIALSTLFANSAEPRDSKRSNSAALSTCTGTPSSIAAWIVQRPSPESDTRPEKPSSAGSLARAAAVRSRSHELTTLPRRQTSATSATSMS